MRPATSMRASLLVGPRQLAVMDIPLPDLREGDVLVRVAAVGICGSDVHFFRHGRVGSLKVEDPLILGHEASGVIVETERHDDAWRIGQRVAIEPQRPCRRCDYCRTGKYNLCELMEFGSAPPVHGTLAEYFAVAGDFAHTIPDDMTFETAALLEPLSVGIAAVRKSRVTAGSRVLIAGAGPIGTLAATAARSFGASHVVVSDPIERRRDSALALGATATIDPAAEVVDDGAFDVFIDASGFATAIDAGLRALRPGGRAVFVGMGSARIDLDLFLVQSKELHLEGLFRYVNTWPLAISIASNAGFDLDRLVSLTVGLDDLPHAMERNGDADVMKIVATPSY